MRQKDVDSLIGVGKEIVESHLAVTREEYHREVAREDILSAGVTRACFKVYVEGINDFLALVAERNGMNFNRLEYKLSAD